MVVKKGARLARKPLPLVALPTRALSHLHTMPSPTSQDAPWRTITPTAAKSVLVEREERPLPAKTLHGAPSPPPAKSVLVQREARPLPAKTVHGAQQIFGGHTHQRIIAG